MSLFESVAKVIVSKTSTKCVPFIMCGFVVLWNSVDKYFM